MSIKSLVRRYLEDGSITGSQVKMFHKAVRRLYMKAFHYSTTHLPLSDELLKNATLLNFKLRTQCTFSQVEYLVQRYACTVYCCCCPNGTARQTGNGEWNRTDICIDSVLRCHYTLLQKYISKLPATAVQKDLLYCKPMEVFQGFCSIRRTMEH